jgi:hypothetical protein
VKRRRTRRSLSYSEHPRLGHTYRPVADMALHCIPDDWDTAPSPTKRAVSHKHSRFSYKHLGARPAAVSSPTTSSLDGFFVSSSAGAGTAQDPPYFSACTPFSIFPDQALHPVDADRYSVNWPTLDHTDCRSDVSRCSSIRSASRQANPVVRLPTSVPGKAERPEQKAHGGSADTALGATEHGLDTFKCRHCEKDFATRSAFRSISPGYLICH